ncbi:MAG: SUMF1/EgtB/PvdO family nonheme iron enzyme [Alphaproteobacteria bacterium]|nr:SUMF1/EgtB/PvdO family nonheme iron enzyme [Alphaproteobacteria bacterium]
MQDIVDEMLRNRKNRINQTTSRFTDPRLRPHARQAQNGYLPVLGAAQNVSIAYTPVTNAEYASFITETGRKAPKDWTNGKPPANKENPPVINVSYDDAAAYADWLTQKRRQSGLSSANAGRMGTCRWSHA